MGNSASVSDSSKALSSTAAVPNLGPVPKNIGVKLGFARTLPTTNNKQAILDEYPELKDSLDFIQNSIEEINTFLDKNQNEKTMNISVKKKMEDIFNFYFQFEDGEHRRMIGEKLAECDAGPLLLYYINLLTDDGNNYLFESYAFTCYQIVMGICLNYTDASPEISVQLCQFGIVYRLLSTLKKFQADRSEHEAKHFATQASMSILHNCAGIDQNKKYFHQEPDMVDVIAWYAKNTSEEENRDLAIVSAIILAEIVEEKDNDVISANDTIIKTILKLLGQSLKELDHRAEGFSSTELANGLTRLANNVENSELILENGILEYVRKMLFDGSKAEKTVAAEALWVLAFSEKNKKKILADSDVMKSLNDYTKAINVPKLQYAATGALWVLNQQFEERKKISTPRKKKKTMRKSEMKKATLPQEVEEHEDSFFSEEVDYDDGVTDTARKVTSGHVMISYQWDNQALMVKLKAKLELEGYKVWIDLQEMGGSTLQAMAEAVENAAVVLIGLSRKYKESLNCRTEAEYAYKCHVPVIPLKVEAGYDPDGWLGAIVGAKFYFSFTPSSNFNEIFDSLKKEIGDRGKLVEVANVTTVDAPPSFAAPPVTASPQNANTGTLINWSNADVVVWAKRNAFKNLKTKSLDGKVLLFLKRLKLEAPEFFFRCAADQLGLKDIRELMMFTDAVANLR